MLAVVDINADFSPGFHQLGLAVARQPLYSSSSSGLLGAAAEDAAENAAVRTGRANGHNRTWLGFVCGGTAVLLARRLPEIGYRMVSRCLDTSVNMAGVRLTWAMYSSCLHTRTWYSITTGLIAGCEAERSSKMHIVCDEWSEVDLQGLTAS